MSNQASLHSSINPGAAYRPGGYTYRFVNSVDARFQCPVCSLVMRDAVQTPCGHNFCLSCIQGYQFCKICNASLGGQSQLFSDDNIRSNVGAMPVYCPNPGCQVTETISQMEYHLQKCEYVACDHCRQGIKMFEKQQHESVCPKIMIVCPYGCRMRFLREQLADHESPVFPSHCTEMIRNCPYAGCGFRGKSSDINDHLKDYPYFHAVHHTDHVNQLSLKIGLLENSLRAITKETQKLSKSYLGLAQSHYTTKQTMSSFIRNQLPPYQDEDWELFYEPVVIPTDGKLVWKITKFRETFSQSRKHAKIYSKPFYTSPTGLKLCCYMQQQENQIMVVFFQIMEGPFDDICDKDNLSLVASVTILNKISENNMSSNQFSLSRFTDDTTIIGLIELISFQQLCNSFLENSTTLFLKVEVN